MDNGEAARVSLALGILIDWIARTDERLTKLEQSPVDTSAEEHRYFRETVSELRKRIQVLENNREVLRRFTPRL